MHRPFLAQCAAGDPEEVGHAVLEVARRAVDGPGEDRMVPNRGFDVHQVFAAPAASELLVAVVGRERMDVLRLDERRG
ncbi:hypothetical protein ACIRSU_06725 [Streptomyces sp. NPDC101160]|uniref:hypothetical protein n=1 Tax=Streptomyces sp. NPDC101160 TaxID=3366118 RepID=UPI0038119F04